MKSIQFPVFLATGIIYLYTVLLMISPSYIILILFFSLTPLLIWWMVVRILKDGVASEKKFSDGYLYEDMDSFDQKD